MPVTNCRVCNHPFFPEPLLRYENMPQAAQNLPTAAMLSEEHGDNLEICQCSGCGLVQLSNDPVPYYREVIRASAFSEEMRLFRLRQFAEFIEKYSLQGKKIVEVGCGRGEYLNLMSRAGADVYGVEYSVAAVKACLDSGLQVEQTFIDNRNVKLNNAPFDAFFIMSYLEHLPDINAALGGASNNLSEDGLGLVEVPNFDMILRNKLFSEFITDHLYYFTKATLVSTLQRNGFDVIECNEIWHDYIISAVVRKRKKLDISHFYECQQQITAQITEYIKQFGNGIVAVWGAGHQALAIIAMANLQNKIKYVIDSAPFKQGKFTPATHLPIVAPDHIDENPPDAIIVIAAAYSDEVAKIIRRKYSNKIKVAILREHGLEIVN